MAEPFDHNKWAFLLVFFVIAWLLLMALIFEGWCLAWWSEPMCKTNGKFGELLQTILASALAFAAGRTSK